MQSTGLGERWTPRAFPNLAAPGQLYPDERYTERFARVREDIAAGLTGVTTDGHAIERLFPIEATGVSTQPLRDAANAFLASLTPGERQRAVFPIDGDEWRLWHGLFTRLLRHGLLLADMSAGQKEKALALLRATLSARGYAATEGIRRTNQLAGEVSGRFMDLGEGLYWFSIFGTPSPDQPWGWQIDGHHINVSCFVLGDQIVMTPAFLGAEPTTVNTGKYAGTVLFRDEVVDALALLASLSEQQRRVAIQATEFNEDVLTGAFRDDFEQRYEGLTLVDCSADQRGLALRLIGDYVGYMRPGHAEVRLAEVTRHLDETHFAWYGGYEGEEPFYYRIHSPVILIEFSHMRGIAMTGDVPSRNHVHTIVRTPNGNDYGKDLLRQHVEQHHRH